MASEAFPGDEARVESPGGGAALSPEALSPETQGVHEGLL